MAMWAERILIALGESRRGLDDDVLAARLGAAQRQTIDEVCRQLEEQGRVVRRVGPNGKILNELAPFTSPTPPRGLPRATAYERPPGAFLSEDEVKSAVKSHLEAGGWTVTLAAGRDRGVDVEAHRAGEHLYLETKGGVPSPQQQFNYFLHALGELVLRLGDPTAAYGLALPGSEQYRGLVDRLPPTAWQRLGLVVLLVDPNDRTTVTVRRDPAAG
jgi:hypothetical protein